MRAKDAGSLKRFESLLQQRSYDFWPEDKLDQIIEVRGTKPDFYVRTPSLGDFLVEVKSFDEPPYSSKITEGNKIESGVTRLDLNAPYHAAKGAAEQLKPYQDLNLPMIIVLDDSKGVGFPVNTDQLESVLYQRFFKPDEKLYVSAVAWLKSTLDPKEGRPDFSRMHLGVVHNTWAKVPLARAIFCAQEDEHLR